MITTTKQEAINLINQLLSGEILTLKIKLTCQDYYEHIMPFCRPCENNNWIWMDDCLNETEESEEDKIILKIFKLSYPKEKEPIFYNSQPVFEGYDFDSMSGAYHFVGMDDKFNYGLTCFYYKSKEGKGICVASAVGKFWEMGRVNVYTDIWGTGGLKQVNRTRTRRIYENLLKN